MMNEVKLPVFDLTKYSTILFDADDTLFDFQKAEDQALHALFASLQLTLTEEIQTLYQEINGGLWKDYEQGKITKKQLTDSRFGLLFARLGENRDGPALNELYLDHLTRGSILLPGAQELCRCLFEKGFSLSIVTNGITRVQTGRFENSALRPYITHLFISDQIGAAKPSEAYFAYVLQHLSEKDLRKILLVGDSLTSDIQGAFRTGIDSCWISEKTLPAELSYRPTYQLHTAAELLSCI